MAQMGVKPEGDGKLWVERMGEQGWGTPTWPKEYGGGGLSRGEAQRAAEEMAAHRRDAIRSAAWA